MNLFLNQVRRSIVHVLDEWAKVAPDTSGAHFGRSDWLSKTTRICLPSGYADNFLHGVSLAGRSGAATATWVVPISALIRYHRSGAEFGWGRASQTT